MVTAAIINKFQMLMNSSFRSMAYSAGLQYGTKLAQLFSKLLVMVYLVNFELW